MADQLASLYGIEDDDDAAVLAGLGAMKAPPIDSTGAPIDPAIADARARGAVPRPSSYQTAPVREAAAVRAAAEQRMWNEVDQELGLTPTVAADYTREDQQIERNLGGGGLDPYALGEATSGRSGQAGAAANQIDDLLMQGYNAPSAPNPLRPIREQYADTMLGDGSMITELDAQGNVIQRPSGLVSQEEFQTGQLHAAQVDEQRAHAAAYAQEAGRQQARVDVMEAKAQRDAQRQQDAIKASQLVMSKVTEAADRLNEAPDIDPNRYWASQSAGRKAGWAISAGLLGFAGLNPFGALQQAISNDIDAQKATFAQKQAGFAARQGELDSSRSVYQDIRTAIGDEQATDLMMEQARLAQAETAFKAMQVKEGIPVLSAQSQLFLTQLQQRNAEITKTLGEMLATTPERIGGGFKPLVGGFQRQELLRRSKDLHAREGKLEDKAIDIGQAASLQDRRVEGDVRVESVKASGRARAAEAKVRAKGAETLAARVQDPQDAISIIDNLLELAEKSGGGRPGQFGPLKMPGVFASDDQLAWDGSAAGLRLLTQKWASGAHLSESQFEQVEKMLPTDSELTGGRAVTKLRNLRRFFQGISKSRQRGFDESTRQFYHRAEDLPSVDPYYTPEDGGDPVDVDED